MTEDILTFTRNGLLAELSPKHSDVAIRVGQEPSRVGNNFLWLHGAYQMDGDDARHLNVKPLLKALVITAVSEPLSMTKNLVGEVVLFEDDETVVNGVHTGYFNYDLADWLNPYEQRTYFVTVSLGRFISNTVCVEVQPIPFTE